MLLLKPKFTDACFIRNKSLSSSDTQNYWEMKDFDKNPENNFFHRQHFLQPQIPWLEVLGAHGPSKHPKDHGVQGLIQDLAKGVPLFGWDGFGKERLASIWPGEGDNIQTKASPFATPPCRFWWVQTVTVKHFPVLKIVPNMTADWNMDHLAGGLGAAQAPITP